MSTIAIKNLAQVLAGINAEEHVLEKAVQEAITQAGLAVERQAKLNASNGTRQRVSTGRRRGEGGRFMSASYRIVPKYHVDGGSPNGPNVITGNLRRSIRTDVHYGFGTYVAEVGAYMEYARAVEFGLPRWRRGGGYPYLAPAAKSVKMSGQLDRVFTSALKRAIARA